jgi:hypothetical protein
MGDCACVGYFFENKLLQGETLNSKHRVTKYKRLPIHFQNLLTQ